MRRIRYNVAVSLDGFIAGPNGEFDWIVIDSEVDFTALWAQFDTLVMGRRTYEVAVERLAKKAFDRMNTVVFSRTLKPRDHPQLTLVPELHSDWVQELKAKDGKGIWLMGGSQLFRSFFHAGLVDTIEVSAIPVLLGDGIPLLPPPYTPTKLNLTSHQVYRSGRVSLNYDVQR